MTIVYRLLVPLALFFSPIGYAAADAPKEDIIDVGIVVPLTGEVASIGAAVQNGIALAYEAIDPALRQRIRLHYQDDAFQPRQAVSALTHLISEKKVDVLVNMGSGSGKAMAPIAEANDIPFIAIATDPAVSIGKQGVFNLWVSVEAETDVALPEVRRRGYKKIARIATTHDMTAAVRSSFDARSKGEPKIALDEEYPIDVRDFKPFLSKVRACSDCDAIMTVLFPGQVGIFAKQARELGVTLPLFSYELFEDPGDVKLSNGALLGQWYVNIDDPSQKFLESYRVKFGEASSLCAASGHDALMLVAEFAKEGRPMGEFPAYLRTLRDFKGASGTFSSAPDNRFSIPATVKVVTATGFEKLRR